MWDAKYLFTNVKDRPVCLECGANVAVTKEYSIDRHYKMKHYNKYKDLGINKKCQKVEEMTDYVQKSHITKRGCCEG